jgi:quercetin dioxygenase-like cupin family protein
LRSWDLKTVQAEPHEPEILSSGDDARAILLSIPAGEELREHEVHEHARIVVIEGELDVMTPEGEPVPAAAGHMLEFVPGERHTVAARADARILLLLTPWPGDGHPGAMEIREKLYTRRHAAKRG